MIERIFLFNNIFGILPENVHNTTQMQMKYRLIKRSNKGYTLNANGLMTKNINKSKPSSRVQLDHVRSFCDTVSSICGSRKF